MALFERLKPGIFFPNPINFFLLPLFFLSSCSGVISISGSMNNEKSFCNHQTNYHYTRDELAKPIYKIELDTVLNNNFSFRALNVANAIGIIDYIQQYIKLKATYNKNETLENRVTLLALSHTINNKINIASLEISSAASELDCEKERASQIANFLKGKEGQRENNLIISSIIVGAAGAIATEILSSQNSRNASTVVGLGASLTGATLGVLMLVNKKKVLFYHTRNTLGEIWNKQPTSSTLPPSIWYYLSYEDLSKNEKSLRNLLVERWLNFGQLENPKNDKKNNELYFGKGGKYTANQLKNRASMYDEIEANITIMKQDLKQLTIEFENLKTNN